MIHQCANPSCCKPFHSLREGRIFVFDLPNGDQLKAAPGAHTRRMRHFWLCSACSKTLVLEPTGERELPVAVKARKFDTPKSSARSGALAS